MGFRYTVGGSAAMTTQGLYADAILSLYGIKDGCVLESTTPNFSEDSPSIIFGNNRKDEASVEFFKKFAINVASSTDEIMGEHGKPVKISGTGDIYKSKKCFTMWIAGVVHSEGGGTKYEVLAAVGYWSRESRNYGGTAGNQVNKFTWTFNCEKATAEDIEKIKTMSFEIEPGFEDGYAGLDAPMLTGNPFSDGGVEVWDPEEALQQILIGA